MKRIALLGATGSLGTHVARQAIAAGFDLSVLVRDPSRLHPEVAANARIEQGDLLNSPLKQLGRFIANHDVLMSCAGLVTEGERFCDLFERVVTMTDSLAAPQRPAVCWFLAGAGLLDIDSSGRRGLDLPKVRDTYWPHRQNFDRLRRSGLPWRLLCPGPMVQAAPIGLDPMRVSIDTVPAPLPAWTRHLPGPLALPYFATRIPQMIIPYADAAAFMLAHVDATEALTHKRIGLALPVGMKGTKEHWAARSRDA